jgi:DNA-directed RNA polymerase specialized sigma24 family protein
MDGKAEPGAEVDHHSPEDFAAAWDSMGDADRVRLMKIAVVLQRPPLLGAADLLQEAYARTFSGDRKWPLGLNFLVFMRETMRSVAHGAAKRAARDRGLKLVAAHPSDPGSSTWLTNFLGEATPVQRPITAEESLVDAEEESAEAERLASWRRQVLDLFEHDEKAQFLVEGMIEGLDGKELQELTGLSGTAFASKRRNVRRRIDKLEEEVRAGRKQA